MSKRILVGSQKDAQGAYIPSISGDVNIKPALTDLSIDQLLNKGLLAIQRVVEAALKDASTGCPQREHVMNLKDCMGMLHELKKKEQELLDEMDEDELKAWQDKNGDK